MVPITIFTTRLADGSAHLASWFGRSLKDVLSVKENRKRTASVCSLQDCKTKEREIRQNASFFYFHLKR